MKQVGRDPLVHWRDHARAWLAARAGLWQYRLRHRRRDAWGGPFNGQEFRQRMFAEMAAQLPCVAIVETGTHRGTTTAFFRRASTVPIYSFEINPRYHAFAAAKLHEVPGLHLHCGDSRTGLFDLANSNRLPTGCVFFYLDAHGAGTLPLADEIHLAFRHWQEAVVIVDDFAVPDDPGYCFDDFGGGEALTLAYLTGHNIVPAGIWFPRCASGAESGARRGCVVLAQDGNIARRLDALATLRRWEGEKTETEIETMTEIETEGEKELAAESGGTD